MTHMRLRVTQRGLITLPNALRQAYAIKPGDELTLLDLGGVFILTPKPSRLDALGNQIAAELWAKGETLETMLRALLEERERFSKVASLGDRVAEIMDEQGVSPEEVLNAVKEERESHYSNG